MYRMVKSFRENLYFFVPFLLFVITLGIILLNVSKVQLHVFINRYNSPFFDVFFKYTTFLGTGLFAVLVSIGFLFRRLKESLFILFSVLVSGFFVQVIKRLLLEEVLRPVKMMEGIHPLHLIDGVVMKMHFSFPSGHSTTAFALFFCLAAIVKNKGLKILFFLIALIIAFSRVYLSQHFFVDIYAGSIIGVVVSLFFYKWIYLSEKEWMNKNIISVYNNKE